MPAAKATPIPFTGDVDEFNDLMKRYHAANLRLWRDKTALTAQYPDQWVGVDENGRWRWCQPVQSWRIE